MRIYFLVWPMYHIIFQPTLRLTKVIWTGLIEAYSYDDGTLLRIFGITIVPQLQYDNTWQQWSICEQSKGMLLFGRAEK
jgi:hypothetical protein